MLKLHFFRIRNFLLGLLLILVLLTSGVTPAGASDPPQDIPTIDPALLAQAARSDSLDFMILFEDQPDLSAAYEMDWEARGWYVYETLTAHAEENQGRVRNFLDRTGVDYQAYWAANLIIVEGASNAALNGLLNYTEIERMQVIPQVMLMLPEEPTEELYEFDIDDSEAEPVETPEPEIDEEELDELQQEVEQQQVVLLEGNDISLSGVESNISQIKADQVWTLGYKGNDMVVGSIDTGVHYTHQALVDQYRGNQGGGSYDHNYSWWDPVYKTTTPVDINGHGTHTVGTMVGDDGENNQIGVAPGAKWVACNAFNDKGQGVGVIACGQFMLAPTNLSGSNPNPSMRPHVVNNSWGDPNKQVYDDFFQDVVDAWIAVGIYPVFANGNSGPGLNTVNNPARYGNVTGVGSVKTGSTTPSDFTSRGSTDNPDTLNPRGYPYMKPQVVAPGEFVRSAINSGNTDYGFATGTSMAAPHVAGMVSLIWQAAPCFLGDYVSTETLIEQTATAIEYDDLGTGNRYPNYATGWGLINVFEAVNQASVMCATLNGFIYDQENNLVTRGVNVLATAQNNHFYNRSVRSDSNGYYQMYVIINETYSLNASSFRYDPGDTKVLGVSTTGTYDNDLDVIEKEILDFFLPLIMR